MYCYRWSFKKNAALISLHILPFELQLVHVILPWLGCRQLLMTAAGSSQIHPGLLRLWPLAEADHSELSDFHPPLNSDSERQREREGHIGAYQKGGGIRSEKQGEEERNEERNKEEEAVEGRDEGGGDLTAPPTPKVLTLSRNDGHQGEGRRWKKRWGGKWWTKREQNVVSDSLQKGIWHLACLSCVGDRQLGVQ